MKENIHVLPVGLTVKYANLEIFCVNLVNSKPNVRVFVVYRPPKNDLDAIVFIKLIIDCITEHSSNSKRIHHIVGDINAPSINWQLHCSVTDQIGDISYLGLQSNSVSVNWFSFPHVVLVSLM